MQTVLLIASGVISCYIFILIFRVLVSWFSGMHYGGVWEIVKRITDPWLNLFRNIRFLTRGPFDFTPIVAILLLQIVAFILRYIAVTPVISLVSIIAAVALAVWHTLFTIIVFFGIIALIRLASILFAKRGPVQLFYVLDSLLQPFSLLIARIIPRGRTVGYPQRLVILLVLIAIICLLGVFFIEPLLYSLLLTGSTAGW